MSFSNQSQTVIKPLVADFFKSVQCTHYSAHGMKERRQSLINAGVLSCDSETESYEFNSDQGDNKKVDEPGQKHCHDHHSGI